MCVYVRTHAHLCLNSPEVDIQCVSQSLTIFLRSSLLLMEHTKFVDFISGGEVLGCVFRFLACYSNSCNKGLHGFQNGKEL